MQHGPGRWIAALFLAWLLLAVVPALLQFRFLYADGAAYLLHIAEHHQFFLPWPGRQAAQVLDQWPAVAAAQAGLKDLRGLAWCLGAGMMLMPAMLHAAALGLLLQRGQQLAAAVYLIMLWLLMLYAGLMSVTESHVSAAVFLLATVLASGVSSRSTGTWLALTVVGALSLCLYEFWFFYAVVLAVAVTARFKQSFAHRSARVRALALSALGLLALSVVVNMLRLRGASDNPNRASFMDMMHGTTLPIYLVLIVGWFTALCVHVGLEAAPAAIRRFNGVPGPRKRAWALLVSWVGLVGIYAVQHDTMIRYSYPFRVLNLALPVLFAVCLFWVFPRLGDGAGFAGRSPLLVVVTVALLVFETWATIGWRAYQRDAMQLPAVKSHGVFHAQPAESRVRRTWIYPWTHSAQSFVGQALREGRVRGVAFDPDAGWDPYGPGNEARLQDVVRAYGVEWKP
jgi:hypothetical protein